MDDTIDRILDGMGFVPPHDEDLRQLARQFTSGKASSVLAYSKLRERVPLGDGDQAGAPLDRKWFSRHKDEMCPCCGCAGPRHHDIAHLDLAPEVQRDLVNRAQTFQAAKKLAALSAGTASPPEVQDLSGWMQWLQ